MSHGAHVPASASFARWRSAAASGGRMRHNSRMRGGRSKRVTALAAVAASCIAAGCGTTSASEPLPTVCKEGFGAVLKALARAPGRVAMAGTPISECFTRNASSDDLEIVGTNLLAAAQQLSPRAHAGDKRAAMQLG